MQNGNGLAHGVAPKRAVKEHEGRKFPLKHVVTALEVKNGKIDGINLSEVNIFYMHSSIYILYKLSLFLKSYITIPYLLRNLRACFSFYRK